MQLTQEQVDDYNARMLAAIGKLRFEAKMSWTLGKDGVAIIVNSDHPGHELPFEHTSLEAIEAKIAVILDLSEK